VGGRKIGLKRVKYDRRILEFECILPYKLAWKLYCKMLIANYYKQQMY
jgi:hypothetical protein